MSTGQFHKLLSPLSLGSGLTLKNRMIKAPQSSWFFEDDGSAGDRVIDFYEAIAAGGVGLVIVSAITWRSDHPAGAYGALHDDRFLPGMKRLVERCHAHGCPVLINGMKTSGKKRDNLGSIGKSFRRGCNSIAESATKKEGNQPSFFVGG